MIYVLHGCGRIIGLVAPEASLCVVAAAEVVLAVAVGTRRIYWAAAPNFADSDQLKVCGRDSGPVIGPCCGDGQNGN
uniref:Secreted protein n=1 Tax=Romanomermis culicivorax TaxID=13658 RepID=A0A915J0P3_ROMCU